MGSLILKDIEVLYQKKGQELHGTDLRVEGRRIMDIGPFLRHLPDTRVLDCRGKVAVPGLVNAHHHFFQTLTRCLLGAQEHGLFEWLMFHYEVWKHISPEAVHAAANLAMAELLLTGCTTTSDHPYIFPRGGSEDLIGIEVKAAEKLGIRFCGTRGSMSCGRSGGGLPPDELVEDDDHVLRHSEEMIRKWHDPSPFSMRQIHLAPCSPFNVTPHLLTESAKLARRHGVRLHTHLAETEDETEYCLEKFKRRPLELMEELDWLGADVWFAHGVHFSDAELETLARTKTGVAHCPSSNMRLGSGVARIPDMLRRGVPVGLAVDGSASNDSSDMLGELRQALLLSRSRWGSSALSARQVISMATEGSARLLGRAEIGTLEAGQAADIAIFDLDTLAYTGAPDPIAALLLCGFNHTAWAVIVNGELVVEEGHLVRADEQGIKHDAARQAKALWTKAGVL
jgi:8-oxoguanine deaminase